ncbi:MAG: class I SAM-dependent methyltransferase [Acidimicrobiia bacterium]
MGEIGGRVVDGRQAVAHSSGATVTPIRRAPGCVACGSPATSPGGDVPDYVQGRPRRTIATCNECGSAFAVDRSVVRGLYEAIYTYAAVLPAYRRYNQYAKLVDRHPEPLAALARLDEVHQALHHYFGKVRTSPGRVLELGSGLGYNTAALRAAGVDALGADLSEPAVRAARARYGRHFEVLPPQLAKRDWIGAFDVVVAAEVLEHVEDPGGFLRTAARYLAPGGTVVVITPRRPDRTDVLWNTDAPPVHLSWFTQQGLAQLAERVGLQAEFLELPPRPPTMTRLLGNDRLGEPILDAWLQPLHRVPFTAQLGAIIRRTPRVYLAVSALIRACYRLTGNPAARTPEHNAMLVGLLRAP